ncbi:MAG: MerR family transcriptional regulator [Rhodobacter sp.]|nr:MerR family transcriptional regulator [Rhodobacter sp.]
MTDALTIQKTGKSLGAAPRSLRPCGQKGLLFPVRDGRPLLFTPHDRARLALILRGGCLGFAPADIRRSAVMTHRRAGPDDAIAELNDRPVQADRGLASCRRDAAG